MRGQLVIRVGEERESLQSRTSLLIIFHLLINKSENWSATSDLLSFKYDLNSPEILLVVLHQVIFHDCS